MTFNRQILFFITGLVLVLFIGTFFLNLSNTQSFLQKQLRSHADDTATSLGLSLSSVADLDNPASIEAMINAVFDRGHYALIALHDVDGELVYQRTNTDLPESVPLAFINQITFDSPTATSLVQQGWMPIGRLSVQANPASAYSELWQVVKTLLAWFSAAAALAIILAGVLVKMLLRPLKQIEIQADAIVRKQYIYQEKLPATLEFKTLVQAMNKMVSQLKEVFDREARVADKLKRMTYQDSVTGLSNRYHFDMMLEAELLSSQETRQGSLFMLRVKGLKELNDQYGYQLGDAFMRELGKKMQTSLAHQEGVYARLSGLELIALLPSTRAAQLKEQAQALTHSVNPLLEQLNIKLNMVALSCVATDYQPGDKRQNLLGQMERGFQQLQDQPQQQLLLLGSNEAQNAKDHLAEHLVDLAFNQQALKLYQQASRNDQDQVHDTEIFVRMQDRDGTLRSAGYFMPAFEQQDCLADLDIEIVRLALEYQAHKGTAEHLAINLSASLLNNNEALNRLFGLLKKAKQARLSFETQDLWAVQDVDYTKAVFARFREAGFQVGIDNFGSRFTDMQYLQAVQPNYIKLDAAFSRRIESDEQTRSYVSSVCELSLALDIPVIAMAVESRQQLDAFKATGINYFQGYLFGAPSPL